jgi:polysaccharide biosynthesis/export protein
VNGNKVLAGRVNDRSRVWNMAIKSGLTVLVLVAGISLTGCKSTKTSTLTEDDKRPYISTGALPGDVVRINFPAAPNLSGAPLVQPDGTITLPIGGVLDVREKGPAEIEKMVLDRLGSQLVVKEVSVIVESAGYPIFVSGAVGRAGRQQCNRPITALEALVQAGGFSEGRANLRKVKVVRLNKDGTTRTIILDLKAALTGKPTEPFYLRPSDVMHVPEKFSFY